MNAKDFDKKFDNNEVDIIDGLDLSTLKRPNLQQKRVNVDFPLWVVDSLDSENLTKDQLVVLKNIVISEFK